MAEFEVKVVKIDDVQEHPNADRLTIIRIGGYTCIANKHEDGSWRYQSGDLVVYIPENAVLPEWLLRKQDMWNDEKGIGYLAGSKGNRVKAIKLRGIFSEGVLYAVNHQDDPSFGVYDMEFQRDGIMMETGVKIGQDVAEKLGITKYEPEIPTHMSGEVFNLGYAPIKFDLEPIEKYPNLFRMDEAVVITEKLHGTYTGISIIPGLNHPEAFDTDTGARDVVVYSKGLGAKGLMFKDNETNVSNLYVMTWKAMATDVFWKWYHSTFDGYEFTSVHILCETYGRGVQDLDYGAVNKDFRLFVVGYTKDRETLFACMDSVEKHATAMGHQSVPILYRGPYHPDVVLAKRDGKTTLGGNHIREGVVVYSTAGRVNPDFGYVRLKSVSPDYKLRKNGSEFN